MSLRWGRAKPRTTSRPFSQRGLRYLVRLAAVPSACQTGDEDESILDGFDDTTARGVSLLRAGPHARVRTVPLDSVAHLSRPSPAIASTVLGTGTRAMRWRSGLHHLLDVRSGDSGRACGAHIPMRILTATAVHLWACTGTEGRHGRPAADARHTANDPTSGPCRSSACAWWLEWAAGFLRRRVGVAESTPRSTQRCRATLLPQAWFARSTQLPRDGCRRWCLPQNAAYAPKTGALPRALAPLRCPQQVR